MINDNFDSFTIRNLFKAVCSDLKQIRVSDLLIFTLKAIGDDLESPEAVTEFPRYQKNWMERVARVTNANRGIFPNHERDFLYQKAECYLAFLIDDAYELAIHPDKLTFIRFLDSARCLLLFLADTEGRDIVLFINDIFKKLVDAHPA